MMKTMLVLIISIAILLGGIIIYNLGILSYTEKQYQFATFGTLIVSYIVSKFLSRKIKKIDMVTSLKGNE